MQEIKAQCSGKTSPRPFLKKSELSISLDKQSKVLNYLLLLNVEVEDYQDILKLRCKSLTFASYKAVLKNKRTETSVSA